MAKAKWRGGTLLAPVPPALVTCSDGERENVLTIAWTGIVNSDPPMISVSIRPERHSYSQIVQSGVFCLNLIGIVQNSSCNVLIFGKLSGKIDSLIFDTTYEGKIL